MRILVQNIRFDYFHFEMYLANEFNVFLSQCMVNCAVIGPKLAKGVKHAHKPLTKTALAYVVILLILLVNQSSYLLLLRRLKLVLHQHLRASNTITMMMTGTTTGFLLALGCHFPLLNLLRYQTMPLPAKHIVIIPVDGVKVTA